MVSDSVFAKYDTMDALVDACVGYYVKHYKKMNNSSVGKRKADLSVFIEKFHRQCGTLTPQVKDMISTLRRGNCIVLMSAHQPNLFAYSGVLRKITLISVLAKKLEDRLKVPVVSFFGIADQDFTDDRWVKTSLLPAALRRDGLISIHVKLPEKMLLNSLPRPSTMLLDDWKQQIERWLCDLSGSLKRLGKQNCLSCGSYSGLLKDNLLSFWDIVDDSYKRCESYSDFNAFIMSKIVNDVWGYDTVFSRFSECQQVFEEEICFLLSNYSSYSKYLDEAHNILSLKNISSGVSGEESRLIPFWYHCDCGSKVRLFATKRNGSLYGYGKCEACDRDFELDFGSIKSPNISNIVSRISLRAISWILVFSKGLGFSCYVGGVGGVWYLKQVKYVADRLGITLPPTPVWRPRDNYLGIGQLEALLKLKVICDELQVTTLSDAKKSLMSKISETQQCLESLEASKKLFQKKMPNEQKLYEELKIISLSQTQLKRSSNLSVIHKKLKTLENITIVKDLIPSIIDYAVNIGLKETSEQWINHLNENGSLSSDVRLNSILGEVGLKLDFNKQDCFQSSLS